MNHTAVQEIQHALRTLSFTEPRIPRLTVDGAFGPETVRAVTVFQELYGLPQSGTVDPTTWDRLRDSYKIASGISPRPLTVFPNEQFVLRVGDTHSSVPVIKAILNMLSERYTNLPYVGTSDIYDRDTAEAVKILRQLHDLEELEETDILVWELLVSLYEQHIPTVGSDTR